MRNVIVKKSSYQETSQKNQTDESNGGDHEDCYRVSGIRNRFLHQKKAVYLKRVGEAAEYVNYIKWIGYSCLKFISNYE